MVVGSLCKRRYRCNVPMEAVLPVPDEPIISVELKAGAESCSMGTRAIIPSPLAQLPECIVYMTQVGTLHDDRRKLITHFLLRNTLPNVIVVLLLHKLLSS